MNAQIETDRVPREQELETPVTEETTALKTSFSSSHLRARLEASEADAAIAAKVTDAAAEMSLPPTLADSVALLRQTQATMPTNSLEVAVKAAKLRRLAAHVHALSQSPAPPRIDQAAHWRGMREPLALALERIASLYPKAKTRKA